MSTPTDWIALTNTSGEIIPAGALARVTGITGGIASVAKPNTDNAEDCVLVGQMIPTGGTGRGTFDTRVIAAYEPADGVPAAGESWGVAAGSWALRKAKVGFRILGGAGQGLVNAVRAVSVASDPTDPASDCTGCGWLAGLRETDCLEILVNGVTQYIYLSSTNRLTWTSTAPITICGVAYTAVVTKNAGGVPQLTLTGTGSGGAVYTGEFGCCVCKLVKWAFPLDVLCPDDTYPGDPCANVVTVAAQWVECCPIAGWKGAGWYCVKNAGSPSTCVVAELLEADKCDHTITICSGPYASEADATVACGGDPPPPVTLTCDGTDHSFAGSLVVTIAPATGTDPSATASGSATLNHGIEGGIDTWDGEGDFDISDYPGFPATCSFTFSGSIRWQLQVRCDTTRTPNVIQHRLRHSCNNGTTWSTDGSADDGWIDGTTDFETPSSYSVGDPGYSIGAVASGCAACAVYLTVTDG